MAAIDIAESTRLAYRHLVSHEEWDLLVRHLMARRGMARHEAEEVMNEALGFVWTAATYPNEVLAPSAMVDHGWDLLVTHTRTYRELCRRLGVDFIDHDPMDGIGFVDDARAAVVVERTVALMGAIGPVNRTLWSSGSSGNGTGSGGSGDGGDGKGWKCCVGAPPR